MVVTLDVVEVVCVIVELVVVEVVLVVEVLVVHNEDVWVENLVVVVKGEDIVDVGMERLVLDVLVVVKVELVVEVLVVHNRDVLVVVGVAVVREVDNNNAGVLTEIEAVVVFSVSFPLRSLKNCDRKMTARILRRRIVPTVMHIHKDRVRQQRRREFFCVNMVAEYSGSLFILNSKRGDSLIW